MKPRTIGASTRTRPHVWFVPHTSCSVSGILGLIFSTRRVPWTVISGPSLPLTAFHVNFTRCHRLCDYSTWIPSHLDGRSARGCTLSPWGLHLRSLRDYSGATHLCPVGPTGFEPAFPAPSGLHGSKPCVLNQFHHGPSRRWTIRSTIKDRLPYRQVARFTRDIGRSNKSPDTPAPILTSLVCDFGTIKTDGRGNFGRCNQS